MNTLKQGDLGDCGLNILGPIATEQYVSIVVKPVRRSGENGNTFSRRVKVIASRVT
jgi:hypothetical protein